MITKQDVISYLESLGSTSDAVANSLRTMGIKGNRALCYSCPIATVLARQFPLYRFRVRPSTVGVMRYNCDPLFSVSTPRPIMDFIVQFDHGVHEELCR